MNKVTLILLILKINLSYERTDVRDVEKKGLKIAKNVEKGKNLTAVQFAKLTISFY